jgi:hypothetical protein
LRSRQRNHEKKEEKMNWEQELADSIVCFAMEKQLETSDLLNFIVQFLVAHMYVADEEVLRDFMRCFYALCIEQAKIQQELNGPLH